ncbi:MAG: hypothetical protein IJY90_00635 [Clostridia bacterium]|nr:hypothetical protein [Clostridia bacterium]
MQNNVNVLVKEDNSVQEKIQKTAAALKEKYSKKRKVNERWLLKGRSKTARVFSVIIDVILVGLCVICCMFGASSFIFKLNNLPPTFAGYSFMEVISPSMVDAGFDIGSKVVIRKVDPKSLDVGDKIAFYRYPKDYNQFYDLEVEDITDQKEETELDYGLTFTEFFGVPSKDISAAAKANSKLVFHTILRIYQDENGMYWFITKGASNPGPDSERISERMVVGVHDDSAVADAMSWLLELLTSNSIVIIMIAIPLILMSISFVIKMIRKVQLTKLELDCIEEKRKITDEICVKNNIGFNMSKEDKYKILVQAPENQREDYMALLWKDGSAPSSIHKYVIRKKFALKENEKMLELNRKCEKMHAEGVDGEEIAKVYLAGKEKIQAEQARYKKIFKSLRKKAQAEKVKPEEKPVETAVKVDVKPVEVIAPAQPVETVVEEKVKVAEKSEEVAAKKTSKAPSVKKTTAKAESENATSAKKTATKKTGTVGAAAKKTAATPAKTTQAKKSVKAETEPKKETVKKASSKKTVAAEQGKKVVEKSTATKKVVETKTAPKAPAKKSIGAAEVKKVAPKTSTAKKTAASNKTAEVKKPVAAKKPAPSASAKKSTKSSTTNKAKAKETK